MCYCYQQEYNPNTQGSFIWTGIHQNNNHSTTAGTTTGSTGNRKIVNRASMVFELLVMSRKLQEDREVELMRREDRCSCNGRAGYVDMVRSRSSRSSNSRSSNSCRSINEIYSIYYLYMYINNISYNIIYN